MRAMPSLMSRGAACGIALFSLALPAVARAQIAPAALPTADRPFGELREQPSALSRRQLAPSAAKRLACRLDRRIDICALPTSDFADLDSARRIFDRQAPARLRLDPAPIDEALVDREPSQTLRNSRAIQDCGVQCAIPYLRPG